MSEQAAAAEPAETAAIPAEIATTSLNGDTDELQDLLGLEREAPPAESAKTKAAAKPAPKADAKAKDDDAPADPDYEAIREINRRSAARRAARRAAEARTQPAPAAAAPAKPAETPKPADPPKKTEPALSGPEAAAAKAAKEVLGLIAKLAGDDAEAAADAKAEIQAKPADEQKKILEAIGAQIQKLTEGSSKVTEELRNELATVKTELETINNSRIVRNHIEEQVENIADELPTLMGKRNAIDLLHKAAGKYWDKHQKMANIPELARRIEKKLSEASAPEKTEKTASKTRKTVSSSLGSPPAARSGPDQRTKEQVEADLFAAFGQAP